MPCMRPTVKSGIIALIFLVYLENAQGKCAFSPPNRHFFSENRTRRTGAIAGSRRSPSVFLRSAHRQFGSLMLTNLACIGLPSVCIRAESGHWRAMKDTTGCDPFVWSDRASQESSSIWR